MLNTAFASAPRDVRLRLAEVDFEAALVALNNAADAHGNRVKLLSGIYPYSASALRVAFFRQCGIHDAIPLSPGVPFTDVQRRYIKNLKLLLDAWDAALVYESTPK